MLFFFVKQKTAYEMRISDWSSDACSSDLVMVEEKLDISGWDLRKALRLFLKSNPALHEWLVSPIVYRNDTGLADSLRRLAKQNYSLRAEIGRASCRERVCKYVSISVVAVSLKKKKKKNVNQPEDIKHAKH